METKEPDNQLTASAHSSSIGSLLDTSLAISLDNSLSVQDQCIRQAQNGNLEAFNELVLNYQDCVFRQALWLLNDETAAEDASQEAFLKAYRKIDTFKGGPFRPWLLKITTNCCLDHIRAAKRQPCQPLEPIDEDGEKFQTSWLRDPCDSSETVLERSEIGARISRSIQKLAPEYPVVVVLVDLQEMDYSEACAILHIPLGTLKSRLARARAKLREDFVAYTA